MSRGSYSNPFWLVRGMSCFNECMLSDASAELVPPPVFMRLDWSEVCETPVNFGRS
jgi:hypothetical protein